MDATIDTITRRFHEDRRLNARARSAVDIPVSYDAITTEWLTDTLCRRAAGASVTAFDMDAPDDGSSNRRRISIRYNEAGRSAALPSAVFCKASHDLNNRILLGISGAARTEVNFYNHLRTRLDIVAPNSYFAKYDEESCASIVMLDDMTGAVEFCDETTSVDFTRAMRQLELLAKWHGDTFAQPELAHVGCGFRTWPDLWQCMLRLGLTEYCAKGLQAAADLQLIPTSVCRRSSEVWPRTLQAVESHAKLTRMLTHNDVHLKNWYLRKDGSMGLNDWQTVAVGNWSRDFAYALSTSVTVENRRIWEKELLKFYLDELHKQNGPAVSFDEGWRLYRQQLFSALASWTVTLTPPPTLPDMQPSVTSKIFLARIGAALDDLDSLDSFEN